MSEDIRYSERLGAIRDEQFAAACERVGVGRFLKAEPITTGLFGQNVFLTTSEGKFVLRGAPHWVKAAGETEWRREDRWQFTKETWFVEHLHQLTRAPVPWPFVHEKTDDIFGWPFIIMQRTPGMCFGDREILTALDADDRRGVAVALGETLVEMQRLTSPFAGDFDTKTIALAPYPRGNTQQVIAETMEQLAIAKSNDAVTAEDEVWIDDVARRALAAGERPNSYVHCDYKLNNLTVMKENGRWRASGLFDFHEARFGDGAIDLVRQACSYLDTDPKLARVFIDSYRARGGDVCPAELLTLYVSNDRMKLWAYFTKPRADWLAGKTFRAWCGRYVDALTALL